MPEAQDAQGWVAPGGPLGELTSQSAVRARESALARRELEAIVAGLGPAASLRTALSGPRVGVIAEVKRSSPSKGAINPSLDAPVRAMAYAAGGAAAVSILTEPSRFGGSLADLREAASVVAIPLLRKDFVTDVIQLLEARAYGASAVLLIARALRPDRLAALAYEAVQAGLEPLIEVRSEAELASALRVHSAVVGVNNRNLETLEIDRRVGERLLPLIPADRIAVYESGVETVADVEVAAQLGADAVLVGSALSAAVDPRLAVQRLAGVARQRRG